MFYSQADLVMAFVEANVLSVITDWLAPMGEKNILPHVQVGNFFERSFILM